MERYTFFDNGKWRFNIGHTEYSGKIADRLAAYENLGYEPEFIKKVLDSYAPNNELVGMSYKALLDKAYDAYKKDWCESRGVSPETVDEEIGINGGECFVCRNEFEMNEFDDREYMAYLLSEKDFAAWECLVEAVEVPLRGVDETVAYDPLELAASLKVYSTQDFKDYGENAREFFSIAADLLENKSRPVPFGLINLLRDYSKFASEHHDNSISENLRDAADALENMYVRSFSSFRSSLDEQIGKCSAQVQNRNIMCDPIDRGTR